MSWGGLRSVLFFGERSDSNQKAKEWKRWAEERHLEYTQFPSKYGSRWNIGFSILVVLLYHHKNLLKFLEETNYKVESSLAPLMEVLQSPALMNIVRIGASIDQVVNGPWWKELESDKRISEINDANTQIIEYLEKVSDDPQLIDSDLPLLTPRSERQTVLRNNTLSQFNSASLDMVPVFYQKISEYLKKQFKHLSENPKINDPNFEKELASAAATNKVSEQTLGIATYYRTQSASTSNARLGYTVAAVKNGTASWYNNKAPKDRKLLNEAAREARKRVRRQLRENSNALKNELIEAQKKKEAQQLKKKAPLEEIIIHLINILVQHLIIHGKLMKKHMLVLDM